VGDGKALKRVFVLLCYAAMLGWAWLKWQSSAEKLSRAGQITFPESTGLGTAWLPSIRARRVIGAVAPATRH
jgi:hypothetical protein